MQCRNQGWKKTLLFLMMFALMSALTGCAERQEIYLAGGTSGPENLMDTESTEEESPAAETPNTVQGTPGEEHGMAREASGPEIGIGDRAATETLSGQTGAEDSGSPDGGQTPAGYVYVCGAVREPGVYPMYEGMRVFEAVRLAGGFAQNADQEWLNQAETVQDGQRLCVYTLEETAQLRLIQADGGIGAFGDSPAVGNSSPGSGDGKVNLNTADSETLKTLPGIGDAKAEAIIQYRQENGAFSVIEEIQNISGIKNAVFAKIKDLITV